MGKIFTILFLFFSSICFSQNSQTIKVKKTNSPVGEWVWTSLPDTLHNNRIETRKIIFKKDSSYLFEETGHFVNGKWRSGNDSLNLILIDLKGEDGKLSDKNISIKMALKNDSMTLYFPIGPRLFIRKK